MRKVVSAQIKAICQWEADQGFDLLRALSKFQAESAAGSPARQGGLSRGFRQSATLRVGSRWKIIL
jgi:hypothetical protein